MRAVFKVVLVVVAGFSLLLVLLAGLFGAALSVLWSVVTGRKPKVITRVTQFKQAAAAWSQRTDAASHPHSRNGGTDVVDVQAREVSDMAAEGSSAVIIESKALR